MKISREQLFGCLALLILASLLMILDAFTQGFRETDSRGVPYSIMTPGTIAVELTGESGRNGVYFVPKGIAPARFLEMAGVKTAFAVGSPKQCPAFTSATTVTHLPKSAGITVEPMAAGKRLALGIPIDINLSSMQDLVLVPGIGEKTAEKILDQRSMNGKFMKLDELMLVKGIKEKRFAKLRRYLCIGC